VAERLKVPVRAYHIAQPEVAIVYERRLVLVRPDGQVTWRDDDLPADVHALLDTVRGARSAL
jgi:hypothetical protein